MKRSPFLFKRYPPSPRPPSVISTPAPATPVAWNCQNSMSCNGTAGEGSLIDLAVLQAVERHAHVLELDHHFDRAAAHVLDRILIPEIVGALDRVVHVPVPVIFRAVCQRRGNATLRCDRMRARRKHLR